MRLEIQEYPSTNSLVVLVRDTVLHEESFALLELSRICRDYDTQAMTAEDFSNRKQVHIIFYDTRKALQCMHVIHADPRFSVVLDYAGGTNRSLVIPSGYSLDLLLTKFSKFGDIEKFWLGDQVVIDFFDSRSPVKVSRQLAGQFTLNIANQLEMNA